MLVCCRYALGMKDLFVALLSRDLLLLKRHSFVYIFRTMQACLHTLLLTGLCLVMGARRPHPSRPAWCL